MFDPLQVEEQDARQDRGGGGRARGSGGRGGGRLVDEPDDDADHADEQDHLGTGEDRGPESSTATPVPEQQTSHMQDTCTEQPPPVVQRQHRIRPWHGTPQVPPFDLGSSSQSTQSTQPSQPGTQRSSVRVDRADLEAVYVRRSKRDRKAPNCGTGSHRG
ncbi:hypothetical protein ACET3Z_031680 [Daucus carota]